MRLKAVPAETFPSAAHHHRARHLRSFPCNEVHFTSGARYCVHFPAHPVDIIFFICGGRSTCVHQSSCMVSGLPARWPRRRASSRRSQRVSHPPWQAPRTFPAKRPTGTPACGRPLRLGWKTMPAFTNFPNSPALTIIVHDGQLYERFHDDSFLKIVAAGPVEFVVPQYLVSLSFQRTGGKVSAVVVNHAHDAVGVKTAGPVPPGAFLPRWIRSALAVCMLFL
jgi:hypothetical protein